MMNLAHDLTRLQTSVILKHTQYEKNSTKVCFGIIAMLQSSSFTWLLVNWQRMSQHYYMIVMSVQEKLYLLIKMIYRVQKPMKPSPN